MRTYVYVCADTNGTSKHTYIYMCVCIYVYIYVLYTYDIYAGVVYIFYILHMCTSICTRVYTYIERERERDAQAFLLRRSRICLWTEANVCSRSIHGRFSDSSGRVTRFLHAMPQNAACGDRKVRHKNLGKLL